VTSRLPTRLPARPLTLSLVGARLVAIAAPPGSRESPVACFATIFPAHPLRLPRGRPRGERRAALGTSAARGHLDSVAPASILAALPAATWITMRPRSDGRSRGRVDHYKAAKWITGTRPLKRRCGGFAEVDEDTSIEDEEPLRWHVYPCQEFARLRMSLRFRSRTSAARPSEISSFSTARRTRR
jgi:hypothetical protein